MEYSGCNLCQSSEFVVFKKIDDYRLVKCKKCGLIYLNPRPDQQELNEKYSQRYYAQTLFSKQVTTEQQITQQIKKNMEKARRIMNIVGHKQTLLDIGCGMGFFIACMRQLGWDVAGIDISQWACSFAKEKLGMNVFAGKVEEIKFKKKFDVITMIHLLEHLPNPLKTLKSVSKIISDEGYLIIIGPNFSSFDRIWHGKNWRGYDLSRHLSHFTSRTYRMILEKSGFFVEKIDFQYWDIVSHLEQMRLDKNFRADYHPDVIKSIDKYQSSSKNYFYRVYNRLMFELSKLLGLTDRDLTIYAKKSVK